MARNTSIIPKAPCGRILQKAGAPRVSEKSMAVFSNVIEEMAEKIALGAGIEQRAFQQMIQNSENLVRRRRDEG